MHTPKLPLRKLKMPMDIDAFTITIYPFQISHINIFIFTECIYCQHNSYVMTILKLLCIQNYFRSIHKSLT